MLNNRADIFPELRLPQISQSIRPQGPLYIRRLGGAGTGSFWTPVSQEKRPVLFELPFESKSPLVSGHSEVVVLQLGRVACGDKLRIEYPDQPYPSIGKFSVLLQHPETSH